MTSHSLCVVKLGGSLLGWDGLKEAFRAWRTEQEAARLVLLVGGGAKADAVREKDRRTPVGDEAAHWQAIEAMQQNTRDVSPWIDLPLCDDSPLSDGGSMLLDATRFLREEEPFCPGVPLPRDWSVSSDSIAARIGIVLGAEEVVMLKSALPRAGTDPKEWAARRYVDPFFPQLTAELPRLRFVDLRRAAEATWTVP